MKIRLSGKKYADKFIIVDDVYAGLVENCKFYMKSEQRFSGRNSEKRFSGFIPKKYGGNPRYHINLARWIMNAPAHLKVDHINRDPFDNRRSNLRLCTTSQNNMNRPPKNGSRSMFKGISFDIRANKWRVQIKKNRVIHIGLFVDELDAAKAYNKAAKKYHGEFAWLNPV